MSNFEGHCLTTCRKSDSAKQGNKASRDRENWARVYFLWTTDNLGVQHYQSVAEAKSGSASACKLLMCITMTMSHLAGKELFNGYLSAPQGSCSPRIGHLFTRQWRILQTANQPITGSITGDPLVVRQSFTSSASQAEETTLSGNHNYD